MKISLITCVFNGEETIKDCVNSVFSQNVPIEHIIIDGGSTDGTLDILEKYKSRLALIVSESDNGVYDAMNKGITMASGDVIGLLNSDDFYAGPKVIDKVLEQFENENVDSCYGDLVYVDPINTKKVIRYWCSGSYNVKLFYWGWMPPHPTFFVRRNIYEKYGVFNLGLGSAADYELMLRFLVKHRISTAYIPEILVKMRSGGMSNASIKNRLLANKNDRLAWKINNLSPYFWTVYMKPLRKIGQYLKKK